MTRTRKFVVKINRTNVNKLSRDISVGVSTRYVLEGPGIDFRSKRDFPNPP